MVVNNFLELFKKQIEALSRKAGIYNNLVIGGSCALQLHGLYTHREPVDLDIIIFQPTEKQMEIIDLLFTPSLDYKQHLPEGETVRSYEFKKDGKKLNVILAKEEAAKDLMFWSYSDMRYLKVNKISAIIDAKCNYSEGKNKAFLRAKDMRDILMLKNLNFNLPESNTPKTDATLLECIRNR